MEPLVAISGFYAPWTRDRLQSNVDENLILAKGAIDGIISEVKNELGFAGVNPVTLSVADRSRLGEAIKARPEWVDAASTFCDTPGAVDIPDWNDITLAFERDCYEGGNLTLEGDLTHTYLRQLRKESSITVDYPSVANVLITADNKIVLGLRGGHRSRGTLMNVPAGAINISDCPITGTAFAEHYEELGLFSKDLLSLSIIGKLTDYRLRGAPHYITRSWTTLSAVQVCARWEHAVDQKEHDALKLLRNVPEALDALLEHPYDPNKISTLSQSPEPLEISGEDGGRLLSHAMAALLLHHAHDKGLPWLRQMGKRHPQYEVRV